jgi:hypothetical protein
MLKPPIRGGVVGRERGAYCMYLLFYFAHGFAGFVFYIIIKRMARCLYLVLLIRVAAEDARHGAAGLRTLARVRLDEVGVRHRREHGGVQHVAHLAGAGRVAVHGGGPHRDVGATQGDPGGMQPLKNVQNSTL